MSDGGACKALKPRLESGNTKKGKREMAIRRGK